jgi:PA14 domain
VAMTKPNSFGQPKPFAGSVEGTVYAIPATSTALPTNWAALGAPITKLYSQSWNIAPHDFKEGFPGVPGDRVEWFAIRWEGTIHITNGGIYHFKVNSDDGSKLSIDGVLVVMNDGLHTAKIAEGNTTLNAGNHTMVLEYFQGPKYQMALQVWVKGTSVPEHILTSSF